jgi:hypothetical protein
MRPEIAAATDELQVGVIHAAKGKLLFVQRAIKYPIARVRSLVLHFIVLIRLFIHITGA